MVGEVQQVLNMMTNMPPLKMYKAKYKCAWQRNPLLGIANEEML